MSTRPERKVLIGLGAIALLAGGVRLWRASHPSVPPGGHEWSSTSQPDDYSQPYDREAPRKTSARKKRSLTKRSSYSTIPIDSTSIIDLDRASLEQIEALGVLKANGARLIVANRDSFGGFGSMEEVERIPYLTRAEIRKLARRVTFSSVPRPRNAMLPGRADSVPGHRRRLQSALR